MWEMSCLFKKMEGSLDTSADVGKSGVSVGKCFCNADLCGRYVAKGYVLTACAFAGIYEKAKGALCAEGTENGKVLWRWRVW